MKEGNAGVEFDREVTVGRGEIAPPTDPVELSEEPALVVKVPDVFDDGVRVAHIKTIVGKGENATITGERRYFGVASLKVGNLGIASHTYGRDMVRVIVKLFEIVVGGGILGGIDADIHDGFMWLWSDKLEKLGEFFGPTRGRDTIGDSFDERHIVFGYTLLYNATVKPKSQNMRVLLIDKYHRQYAGPQRLYFDTAKLLRTEGHEVAFFAMAHPKNESTEWSRYFVKQVDYEEANQLSLWDKFIVARNIIWNPEAKRNLEALIDEFKPDVAHLFVTYHQLSPSIIWALKKKGVPIVMTLCDYKLASPNYSLFVRGRIWEHASGFRCLMDRCVKDSYGKSLVCAVEQWLHRLLGTYGQVDAYIGLSQFLIDTYKRLDFPYEIRLLPQPLVPLPDVTAPLPAKTGKNFLYFGRLSAEKGIGTLIRAFAELQDGETLSIVGFGPEEERLKALTTELALLDKVKFLGPVYGDGLQDILLPALAVVVPSEWYENTPYALLETLASGTPVIAARVGSLPERVQDGYNGFLFTPGDAHDLADKIRALDTVSLPELQKSARESVMALDAYTYLSAITDLYSSLVRAKK